MLEYIKFSYAHFTSCGTSVVFKHIDNGIPQKFKVFFRKLGNFLCKHSRHISVRPVQAIRYYALSAHSSTITFISSCLSCNCYILSKYRINTLCKTNLNRTSDNTAWVVTCTHNRTECSYIKIILTYVISCRSYRLRIFTLLTCLFAYCLIRLRKFCVKCLVRLYKNIIIRLIFFKNFHKVADFSL